MRVPGPISAPRRLAAMLLLAASALGPGAAWSAGPAGGRQAIYDAAQAAFDRGDWTAAADGFQQLTASAGTPARADAVIASRLGVCLLHLGRMEEARAASGRAVAGLGEGDPGELSDALVTAADADRFLYNFQEAAGEYRRALSIAQAQHDLASAVNAHSGLVLSLMTDDPSAAAAQADALVGDKALMALSDKAQTAVLYDLRARAAMNAHDLKTAARWVERSISAGGGLTEYNVSSAQIDARNDAALIYALQNNEEATRKYLAYTGAGHLKDLGWIGRFSGDLPVCGEDDSRPEDVVVVKFAIDSKGEVRSSAPLYASRPGPMGAGFARAVSRWAWDPEALKTVAPFWRNNLVLQLRCQSRPTPLGLGRPVMGAFRNWLKAKGVQASPDETVRPSASEDAPPPSDDLSAVPALFWRMSHDSKGSQLAPRVERLLDAHQAPPEAHAVLVESAANLAQASFRNGFARRRARAEALDTALPAFAARFPSTLALAWLQLEAALDWEDLGAFPKAAPLLKAVLATSTTVLPDEAPIRRVALLHAAIVARHTGDTVLGAGLPDSGLAAEQCSLFDTHPLAASQAVSAYNFPQDAQRWGFEGYVRESYDIADNGRVANPRAVVAYPPLIFEKSSDQAVQGWRYDPPKIGSKAVGCVGQVTPISYRLPYKAPY